MARRVDWTGRGPTWLGVPALVVTVIGGLGLIEFTHRQNFTRDLVTNGRVTVAESVKVDVGRSMLMGDVEIVFRTPDRRQIHTVLADADYNDDGGGMLAGGSAVTLFAMAWLTRDVRRRGLHWWELVHRRPDRSTRVSGLPPHGSERAGAMSAVRVCGSRASGCVHVGEIH